MSATGEDAGFGAVRERINAGLNGQGMLHHLGVEIDEVAPGRVTLSLPFRKAVAQQNGFFHGAAIGFLVDDATAAAAGTVVRDGETVLTAEYKINFVAPGIGERLVCRAEAIKAGRTLIPVEARVFAVKDGRETLCAVALASMAVRAFDRLKGAAK
ncbi:PaaI family thioesterase [Phenylobacterium sp.]|uniref:PaaI family thioesterase n=1 Tax=Phenylobacterium sp. TaxID=1871053 RepID=UPI00391875AB